jgi:hypothetical protein
MGFLDKVKQQTEQVASKAKGGVADVQTKRELGQAYSELGQKTYELAVSGAISSPELDPIVERIGSLKAKLESEDETGDAATPATDTPPASAVADANESPPSDQPPAMPS